MRIEISAKGQIGAISVRQYQENATSLIEKADCIISCFQTIKKETYDLAGGLQNLQETVEYLEKRIQKEEKRRQQAQKVQKKTNDFVNLAVRVDNKVAELVTKNREQFFTKYPHLAPASFRDRDKHWYEKTWDWLCGAGEAFVEGVKETWNGFKDTVKKAWDGIVDFYEKHKNLCKILIGVAAIAIAVVVTVATGGAALPALLAMAKTAIVAGLTSAAIGGGITAVVSLVKGESVEDTMKAAFDSAVDGFCTGFMWGGIFAAGSQIVSCIKAPPAKQTLSGNHSQVSGDQKITDINQMTDEEFEVMSDYHANATDHFNPSARNGISTDRTQALDKVINNHSLSEDSTFLRGSSRLDLQGYQNCSPQELIGKEISMPGYTSTTQDINLAKSYTQNMFTEIHATSGTKMLDLSGTSYFKEAVFPRNTIYQITNAWEDSNGILNLIVNIK